MNKCPFEINDKAISIYLDINIFQLNKYSSFIYNGPTRALTFHIKKTLRINYTNEKNT